MTGFTQSRCLNGVCPWAAAAAFFCCGVVLPGQELEDGLALLTTVDGQVRFESVEGDSQPARLHQSMTLSGTRVTTGEKSFCGLSLSNGAGLVLGPESQVSIGAYRQRPYPASEQSLEYEASVSHLELTLESGRIAMAAGRLSPLSKINVSTPYGVARTHSALGFVAFEEDRVELTAIEGNLVFTFFDTDEREFLGSGRSLRITKQSALRAEPEVRSSAAESGEAAQDLVAAATQASRRVLFLVEGLEPGIPSPRLATPADASTLPSPRPYGYRDAEF